MQADVIKESMPFLMYIMRKLSKGKGSKKSKKKKNTFRKSVSQKNKKKKIK